MGKLSTFLTSVLTFLACLALVQGESLRRSQGCDDLLSYFKENALKRVGPCGLSPFLCRPVFFRGKPVQAFNAAPAAVQSEPSNSQPEAGVDFSDTNVQVEGVDEPDIVKTDGKRVFVLRQDKFYVVDVEKDGMSGRVTANLTLPMRASEMLVEGNTVLVIASGSNRISTGISLASPRLIRPGFRNIVPTTVLYKISLAEKKPRIVSTLVAEGSYMNAREVDGIARIIIRSTVGSRLKFQTSFFDLSKNSTSFNIDVIKKSTIADWLPRYKVENECSFLERKAGACGLSASGFLPECGEVYLSKSTFTGFSLVTVLTVALRGNLKPRKSVSIVSGGEEIYSTAKSLYITTTQYRYDFPFSSLIWGSTFKTSLHKFELSNSGSRYIASGEVLGSVLNQFSMHEFNNRFFVATTEGASWWTRRDLSKSKVTSFEVRGAKLTQIGEVGNLGIGERIFAVRYVASTAYVVTFRQIDPLYIIDLSIPTKLIVTGELKIPGFSSYLHPIAPGRILGVGREATPEGRTTGAKVTLFDVSDTKKPRELATWTLKGSYSNAEFDHRAFLYWDPESIAVLPVRVVSSDAKERFSGSVVLDISDAGINERGRISHVKCCLVSTFQYNIERNFVLGRTNLWSLSTKILQINDIKTLDTKSQIVF